MAPDWENLLEDYDTDLADLGVAVFAFDGLVAYLEMVWEENQRINLFSRKMEPRVLIEAHLLDSLAALPFLPDVAAVADLGTGGGFPAIPLALCRPQTRFFLFEKSPQKNRSLRRFESLPLKLEVMGAIPEDGVLPKAVKLVTARAFKPIGTMLHLTRPFYEKGGRYMLHKARREKIDSELAACGADVKARIQALKTYGGAEERHLVWIND
ncbi:Ribosomal RNA small subunit methyltransferase G [Acanthopleuribacter pedis]|uniref:Ribosomal RNA small subunit methyltransferase G n=2 Tax=Acanthopleuribacter pedis TaxID=442870 RepID=A0A8J7U270_9BACT|nr:class I SAM-dependent methyltransferase [Acanthopleuribacter pedis]